MNKYLVRPWHLLRRQWYFKGYFQECHRNKGPSKLHVGCGNRPISGWCNIDVAHLNREVQYVDAMGSLPFEEAVFDFVFSEHFIEHFEFDDGMRFFKEALRVLKPGGILRTATPDLKFLAGLYGKDNQRSEQYLEYVLKNFDEDKPQSPAVGINRLFYGWGHRFLYDSDLLNICLAEVGFGRIRCFRPGESKTKELIGLEQHGKSVPAHINEMETFVLEATKI